MGLPVMAVDTAEPYLDFVETFNLHCCRIKEVKHKNWTNKNSKTLKMY